MRSKRGTKFHDDEGDVMFHIQTKREIDLIHEITFH